MSVRSSPLLLSLLVPSFRLASLWTRLPVVVSPQQQGILHFYSLLTFSFRCITGRLRVCTILKAFHSRADVSTRACDVPQPSPSIPARDATCPSWVSGLSLG